MSRSGESQTVHPSLSAAVRNRHTMPRASLLLLATVRYFAFYTPLWNRLCTEFLVKSQFTVLVAGAE